MDNSTNCRLGHRARVRGQFLREGIAQWDAYRVLELLLFYCIPRRDVKPLAHQLIQTFGSLGGVLQASPEALHDVSGLGDYAAGRLCAILPLARAALEATPVQRYDTSTRVGALLRSLYRERRANGQQEDTLLLLFDSSLSLLGIKPLTRGGITAQGFQPRLLTELAYERSAAAVLVSRYSTSPILVPTAEELAVLREIHILFNTVGLDFLDYVLINGDNYAFVAHKMVDTLTLHQKKERLIYDDAGGDPEGNPGARRMR